MRRGSTITVEANVDTYVDVDIDVSEFWEEISDDEVKDEARERGILTKQQNKSDLTIDDLHIMLCDRYAKNHHTAWSYIIAELNKESNNHK